MTMTQQALKPFTVCGRDFGPQEATTLQQVNNRPVPTCREGRLEAVWRGAARRWEVCERSPEGPR